MLHWYAGIWSEDDGHNRRHLCIMVDKQVVISCTDDEYRNRPVNASINENRKGENLSRLFTMRKGRKKLFGKI